MRALNAPRRGAFGAIKNTAGFRQIDALLMGLEVCKRVKLNGPGINAGFGHGRFWHGLIAIGNLVLLNPALLDLRGDRRSVGGVFGC